MIKKGKPVYAGVLAVPEGKSNAVAVRHVQKPPGTVLRTGTIRTAIFGQRSEALTFDEATTWHELSEEGHGVWMTDLPIEQRQTDELIRKASGRVLVGGLGLGYAVVALAAKRAVKEIVIVERSPDIINLVMEPTLATIAANKSSRSTRVTCVEADLFDYLDGSGKHHPARRTVADARRTERVVPQGSVPFDWGLFDIWQMDSESTFHSTIVPLRKLAQGVVRELVCWNEDIMRGQLQQGLQTRLLFLRMPRTQEEKDGGFVLPTIEFLCEPHDSIYTDWAVPFWRWYREHADKVDPGIVSRTLRMYALCYGRPECHDGRTVLE